MGGLVEAPFLFLAMCLILEWPSALGSAISLVSDPQFIHLVS